MFPLLTILVSYLYFCLYAGPRFMKDRKPLQLRKTLIVYNAIQVVVSIYLVYEGLEAGWRKYYSFTCQPVDYTDDPLSVRVSLPDFKSVPKVKSIYNSFDRWPQPCGRITCAS